VSGEYAFKFTEMTDERFYVGPDGICSEGLLWNVVDASLCHGPASNALASRVSCR
jgi:hypothetical protein